MGPALSRAPDAPLGAWVDHDDAWPDPPAWRPDAADLDAGPISAAPAQLEAARSLIDSGAVATLVLAGGLGMRLHAGPKACVRLTADDPSSSLLALHAARARRDHSPLWVMTSYATHDAVLQELRLTVHDGPPRALLQGARPRRRADTGAPLWTHPSAQDADPWELWAANGHADAVRLLALHADELRAQGIEHVMICNVDNLGARLHADPLSVHLAAHAQGAGCTFELANRASGDTGGFAVQWDHALRIADPPRLRALASEAPSVAALAARATLINTNTVWIALDTVGSLPMPPAVDVQRGLQGGPLDGVQVLQAERMLGELTWYAPCGLAHVDRARRFSPIKDDADLARARAHHHTHGHAPTTA